MADSFKYVQAQNFTLSGAGALTGATSITLQSFQTIDGTDLAMTDFGAIGFGTLEPGSGTQEEQISFTGVTQNSNGTATLTGVSSVAFISPYTQTSGLAKTHPGSITFVISNTAGFYDELTSKDDDETVNGKWTFPDNDTSRARITSDTDTAVATAFVTLGQLSRQAIAGASNASTTVKGLVELATQAETDARTTTGGTGALLVPTPDVMRSTQQSDYVIDTGAADAYAIAPTPAITAYATGQIFSFKAIHTNTTISTLAVSGLTTKTIKKLDGATDLAAGDIVAGQIVDVEYDGTNFQMLNPVGNAPLTQATFNAALKFGGTGADGALAISSGTTTINLGNAAYVVKNYTSISINGTGVLAFSNPATNGTTVILKSQGAVTLTSSATPMIDGSSLGGAGGAAVSNTAGNDATGNTGSASLSLISTASAGTSAAPASNGAGGAALSFSAHVSTYNHPALFGKYWLAIPGAGGGSGSASGGGGSGVYTTGVGGRGGGAIVIECRGAWNFTTSSGISVAGANGGAASKSSGTNNFGGGGGGGGGGFFYALYNTLTANSGTITVSGGSGGAAADGTGAGLHGGGGGGASSTAAGSNGANDAVGGAGATGFSLVASNTEYV